MQKKIRRFFFRVSGPNTTNPAIYNVSKVPDFSIDEVVPIGRESMNRRPAPVLYLPYCSVSLSQLGDKVNSDASPPWAYWTLVATLLV